MAESYVPDESFFLEDPFMGLDFNLQGENRQLAPTQGVSDRQLALSLLANEQAERKKKQELVRRQCEQQQILAACQKEIEDKNRKID